MAKLFHDDLTYRVLLEQLERSNGTAGTFELGDALADAGIGEDSEESYNLAESAIHDLVVARVVTWTGEKHFRRGELWSLVPGASLDSIDRD